jgi:hypothetical protein
MVQLLILGEVCSRQDLFTRSLFKVPLQRCSGYTEGIADFGNAGVRVLHNRPGGKAWHEIRRDDRELCASGLPNRLLHPRLIVELIAPGQGPLTSPMQSLS